MSVGTVQPLVAWLGAGLDALGQVDATDTGRSFRFTVGGRTRRLDIASDVLARNDVPGMIATLSAAHLVEKLRADCTWAYLTPAGLSWLCADHEHPTGKRLRDLPRDPPLPIEVRPRLRCTGGPLDGQTIHDRGYMFQEAEATAAGRRTAMYVRTGHGYAWMPAVEQSVPPKQVPMA